MGQTPVVEELQTEWDGFWYNPDMVIEEQIRLLRQIQHLVLIREEGIRVGDGSKSEEFEAKIAKLVAALAPETAALQAQLLAKDPIFLSPLAKGNCSACGQKMPMAQLQHVLAKDRLVVCSRCGRIVYVPEVKATGLKPGEPDPKFLLSRFSTPKLMVPALKATTPEGAIRELCAALAKEKVVADVEAVVSASLEREAILTTAVGNGLAFPHMRGVEEGVLTLACGVSPNGIDWNGRRVHLVFFSVFPIIASPFYLKLLAALAATFEDGEQLPFVLAAGDAKTLWKELNKVSRAAVKGL